MDFQAFCETLYGDAEHGWLTLAMFKPASIRWFRVGKPVPKLNMKRDSYLSLGLRKNRLPKGERGGVDSVIGIPGLWLDLDFESDEGAHKNTQPLPPDLESALTLLETAPLPASLIIHSGHGLQAYWLFSEAWYFADDQERGHARALCEAWQGWFQSEGAKCGWHVDSTADLARVFRIPGSLNHKTDPPKPVHVLSESPFRFEPGDFEIFDNLDHGVAPPQARPQSKTSNREIGNVLAIPRLGDRLKYLILHGDTLKKYPSRSEAVYAAINGLIQAGCDDQEIVDILMNDNYDLSELPIEKGEAWLRSDIKRALQKPATDIKSYDVPNMWEDSPDAEHPNDSLEAAIQSAIKSEDWQIDLLTNQKGAPTANIGNFMLILEHHDHWKGRFWWDELRSTPMIDNEPVSDERLAEIGKWLHMELRMSITNITLIRVCVYAICHNRSVDLLKLYIDELPKWDSVDRLDYWLSHAAGTETGIYGAAVSRLLPVSMIARVLDPGCLYRSVIILQGDENTGKSSLVRELAGEQWYVELTMGFETKDAHMILQGAWLAELAELDSLSRTEETRLKAFITTRQDSWIPKYSNTRIDRPRRTIFIGTTNDSIYLKGQTGNTRFLPIKTGVVDLHYFRSVRDQVLAEALVFYQAHLDDWWEMDGDVLARATQEREERRIINPMEELLQEWLYSSESRTEAGVDLSGKSTTWTEIADKCLGLEKHQWSDRGRQMQVAQAMKALGWINKVEKIKGKSIRKWNPPA